MILNTRKCMVFKHQSFPCSHVCTFKDCDLTLRWACGECIKNQLHQHGQNTQNHLMGQEEFKNYFKQIDIKQLQQEQKISEYLKSLDKIKEQINQFDQYLQLCLKESDINTFNDIKNLIDYNFFQIDNGKISQIVKVSHKQKLTFDQNKVHEIIKILIDQCQKLLKQDTIQAEQTVTYQNFINNVQHEQNKKKIKLIEQKPILEIQQKQQDQQVQQEQYQVQQVQQPLFTQVDKKEQLTYNLYKKFQQNQYIYAAQISQNEKYLAYGGDEKVVIIYDLQTQTTKEIKFDQSIQACCFSKDSKQLYIGCEKGYFLCVQFQNNINYRYKEQLHQDDILNIYQLENDQVISGSQKNIIIADIKQQKKIHKLDAPEHSYFSGLDVSKNLQIIVTGLSDFSIQFYNQQLQLQLQINKSTINPIHSIRFLDENQIVILDNQGTLKLWQIDYNKKTYKYMREIQDQKKICNLGVSINSQIIIICRFHFVIFDQDFKNPQTIEHAQGNDVNSNYISYLVNRVQQLQSMNYIIIQGSNKITIMRRIEN